MRLKIMVLLFAVILVSSSWALEQASDESDSSREHLLEAMESSVDPDLDHDSTLWRWWKKPWKFWKWDSQRTLTRRSSSLIVSKRLSGHEYSTTNTRLEYIRDPSLEESMTSFIAKIEAGAVRRDLVNMLFESMLPHIIESWETIKPKVDMNDVTEVEKTVDLITKTKKKGQKIKKSRQSLVDDQSAIYTDLEERAIIHFRNGNIYEGSISMKCMNGDGRFQWADGTTYLGSFKRNSMSGKGFLQWKDETWYEGEFLGNLRHGYGLYVDSRRQRFYSGEWYCGTKHGEGLIYYSINNSYNGRWEKNVRTGFGKREYCPISGYKGEWDNNIIEGKGLMIWPNHDFYRGEWHNGQMWGYGIYIWDMYYNDSMSQPSVCTYRGHWERGMRHGYGVLNLGYWLGALYKGSFKFNKKHGTGRLVTNNGSIIQSKTLFNEDNMNSLTNEGNAQEPHQYDICGTIHLLYHIGRAYQNIDREKEERAEKIKQFLSNNNKTDINDIESCCTETDKNILLIDEFVSFEERSLKNALLCYQTQLRNIYYQYATICNKKEIQFAPILIRLYLWQLYYDCDIHNKGLTLTQIDKLLYRNSDWLANTVHNAFEKIYFWQFLHSLITVASELYCAKKMPGARPESMLATAFRQFMETDLLPGAGKKKGKLLEYAQIVPLKSLYRLYRRIGEPHSVRMFLSEVRQLAHLTLINPQPMIIDVPRDELPNGFNAYILGDEIDFVNDDKTPMQNQLFKYNERNISENIPLKLFNIGNLSSRTIIDTFAQIFPQIICDGTVTNMNTNLSFLEFFEAFIICVQKSIQNKEEELQWRSKFSEEQALIKYT